MKSAATCAALSLPICPVLISASCADDSDAICSVDRPLSALVPSARRSAVSSMLSCRVVSAAAWLAISVANWPVVSALICCVLIAAICDGLLGAAQGFSFRHVCLVNNHLEPAHDAAIRAVLPGREGKVSVACPLAKQWARTLSDEFKSGACHAGQYESSLVMAARPELVAETSRTTLAEVPISLSDGIRDGKSNFREMGMNDAYAGAPAAATAEEGEQQLALLATMIVTEVTEGLAARGDA